MLFLTVGDVVKQYRWNGADWEYVTGEDYAQKLNEDIQKQFEDVDTQIKAQQEAQDKQYSEVLALANANTSLANEAKTISDQAKTTAADALAGVASAKSDAITEAKKLIDASQTALDSQIKAVDVKVDDVTGQVASKASQSVISSKAQLQVNRLQLSRRQGKSL